MSVVSPHASSSSFDFDDYGRPIVCGPSVVKNEFMTSSSDFGLTNDDYGCGSIGMLEPSSSFGCGPAWLGGLTQIADGIIGVPASPPLLPMTMPIPMPTTTVDSHDNDNDNDFQRPAIVMDIAKSEPDSESETDDGQPNQPSISTDIGLLPLKQESIPTAIPPIKQESDAKTSSTSSSLPVSVVRPSKLVRSAPRPRHRGDAERNRRKEQKIQERLTKIADETQRPIEELAKQVAELDHVAERIAQGAPTMALCALPMLPADVVLKPLPTPIDAWSTDGQTGITILTGNTGKRDCPVLNRFIYCADDEADALIGPAGRRNPSDAYVYPSLDASARRTNLKHTCGWNHFYVLVVHNNRTYRAPLIRFRVKPPKNGKPGPGFVQRPGMEFTADEIERLCVWSRRIHADNSKYLNQRRLEHIKLFGSHRALDVLPAFLEPVLRVIPTTMNPAPNRVEPYGSYSLLPVTRQFHPTFLVFND